MICDECLTSFDGRVEGYIDTNHQLCNDCFESEANEESK